MKKSFKKVLCLLSFAMVPALIFGSTVSKDSAWIHADAKLGDDEITGVVTNPKQYVGYGYNVISGKALYESDALMLNNPILDVDNKALQDSIKVFDGSKTEYQSSSSTSVKEISKRYGTVLAGGGGIGGGIASFSVDIEAKFARGATESWAGVSNEEYSYYTIFTGNRPVILQMDYSEMVNYLTPSFKKDILSCKKGYDAQLLFNKYGTHLLTGYTLGGIFEMTNYYATNSSTYNKEGDTSFDAQVNIALGSFANGNGDFSFTNNYGYLNNNKYATNQYKCTTYGGLSFPGLTIDQAFSWYETATDAGYVYQLWTDSINAGRNLVIVNIPQSSKMVPLWDLLPNTEEYAEAKFEMMTEYQKLTKGKYLDYKDKYPDRFKSHLGNDRVIADDFDYVDYGFNYSTKEDGKFITSYVDGKSFAPTSQFAVRENSYVYMDYDQTSYVGQDAHWVIDGSRRVSLKDEINGVIEVGALPGTNEQDKNPEPFTASFYVNGVKLFSRRFLISANNFAGGSGTEESPYLIANSQQFVNFARNADNWAEGKYYKLINNIDLRDVDFKGVGSPNESKKFAGVFDGNNYTISNYRNNDHLSGYYALFQENVGVIKNVNLDFNDEVIDITDDKKAVGLLVAVNSGSGRVENCSVSNAKITYNGTYASGITSLRIGGAIAYNTGTVTDTNVDNVNITVKVPDKYTFVHVGNFCGAMKDTAQSHQHAKVDKCEVSNSSITYEASSVANKVVACLGGFVGYTEFTDFNDCLVKNMSIAKNDKHISFNVNSGVKDNSTCVGGFAGVASENQFKNIVVYNSRKIQGIDQHRVNDEANGIWSALFIGRCPANVPDVTSSISVSNCYINNTDKSDNIIRSFDKDHVSGEGYNVYTKVTFTKSDFGGEIVSDLNKWRFNENEPRISLLRVNDSSLYLDTSETKKVFYEGEEFTYKNIKIKGSLTNGEEFEDKSALVDASGFYDFGTHTASVGPKIIRVYCMNQIFEYTVNVIPAETDHIYVEEKTNKTYFTHENNFDTNSVIVHKVDKNGKDTVLDYDETGKTGYTFEIPTGEFVEGNNEILFKFDKFEYTFNVDAINRDVKEIVIDNKEALAMKEFKVGADNLDLNDMQGHIVYENGDTRNITGKDCDFIYSRIRQGSNRVIATYDVAYQKDFTVNGVYTLEPSIVEGFIAAVNAIDLTQNLYKQYDLITAAYNIYKEIGSEYVGDEAYEQAKATLLEAIDKYNQTAEDINTGFEDAIGVSGNMVYTIVGAAGFTGLSALLTLILKRL